MLQNLGITTPVKVGAWERYEPFFKKVTLMDGTIAPRGAYLMRRKVNGVWQYRYLTDSDIDNIISEEAW